MRYVLIVLRVALGIVFLYAAYTKLRQPWLLFAMSIDAYQILPEWAALTLGRTLPWMELVLGALLATGFGLRYSAVVATALLGVFFAVMAWSYAKGMKIDCACFGFGEAIGPATLVRDAILLSLSITLTILTFRFWKSVTEPRAQASVSKIRV